MLFTQFASSIFRQKSSPKSLLLDWSQLKGDGQLLGLGKLTILLHIYISSMVKFASDL